MAQTEITYGLRAVSEAIDSEKVIDKIFIQKGLGGELFKQLFYKIRQHKMQVVKRRFQIRRCLVHLK